MSVSLSKGQQVRLRRSTGEAMTLVRMGLGWQAVPKRGLFGSKPRQIDLDASALLYTDRVPTDVVFFKHLVSNDGSVRHAGDSRVGGAVAGGDDESIVVDLSRIPARITQLVFTVSSYGGQPFTELAAAHCRLVDEFGGQELARYELAGGGAHTGQIMAKVYREPDGDGWAMQAIGAVAQARTFQDMLPAIAPFL
ncbi:Tellurium resistance protein terZ [Streptomyces tateyamensis]|uniref:Tellurium resistance protein terZ n=1 Tax=Streptomyces tateyamensis TaxID=565073 RepID=A0A2V4NK87_9ACTN|nr:TerD family protein [Streptomyces tateyamensis]PYC73990.1 Tellurium resistance protein terZ [Streptomyces tateyamensis]